MALSSRVPLLILIKLPSLRQSIEDDEPLVKIVSDVMDIERNSEDSMTPSLDDQAKITLGEKRLLPPDQEVPEETPKKKPGRPAKRQRRTGVKEAVAPRRSARLSSVASSAKEEKRTPTPTPTRRGRGRPPNEKLRLGAQHDSAPQQPQPRRRSVHQPQLLPSEAADALPLRKREQ